MAVTQKIQAFFKEVWVEMKRVSWSSRSDVMKYTILVLGATVIVAAFLGGLDYLFSNLIKIFVLKQ